MPPVWGPVPHQDPSPSMESPSTPPGTGHDSLPLRRRPDLRVIGTHLAAMAAAHAAIFSVSWFVSFLTRFDFHVDGSMLAMFHATVWWVVVVKTLVFLAQGQFSWLFGPVAFADVGRLVFTTTIAALTLFAAELVREVLGWGAGEARLPRSVLLIDWAASIILVGAIRALPRTIREELRPLFARRDVRLALVVGAGPDGEVVARNLLANASRPYAIPGFVDSNILLKGKRVAGIPVLGTVAEMPAILARVPVDEAIVASGAVTGAELRKLLSDAAAAGVTVRVIPSIDDLLTPGGAAVAPAQLRPVELRDLLRREPVSLDDDAIRDLVAGRVIVVTGGGGSIGSELCRQVLRFRPARVVAVDHGENALFHLEQELARHGADGVLVVRVADITDEGTMRRLLAEFRPALVFHAAAHKHVPLMESSPAEAIKNNCLATALLARLADEAGVGTFVMISTDKAVNPTSVMGCTKLIAERAVRASAARSRTTFVIVRFGNVLGSNGSVVPTFEEQIRRGGPVTVTHPDVTRFFMMIPEAAQLVIQAAAMGRGGETFVLDMGGRVRIVDLARDVIALSGRTEAEIGIVFTGLRPGEKLYEELTLPGERRLQTAHPKVTCVVGPGEDGEAVERLLAELRDVVDRPPEEIRAALSRLVPEYVPEGAPGAGSARTALPEGDGG